MPTDHESVKWLVEWLLGLETRSQISGISLLPLESDTEEMREARDTVAHLLARDIL